MQVFKLYLKMLRQNLTTIVIYLFVTFICAVVFVKGGVDNNEVRYMDNEIKPSITIVNKSDSEYALGFEEYLKETCVVEDVREDLIEDALFYKQIAFVLYIPKNFDELVMSGNKVNLEMKMIDDLADAYLAKEHVASYVKTLQTNNKYGGYDSKADVILKTKEDLSKDIDVSIINKAYKQEIQHYFNFLSYTFCSCLIGGIGYAMIVLRRKEIARRNAVSPIKNTQFNVQLLIGYLLFSICLGCFALLVAYIVFPEGMHEKFVPYMIMNMFVCLVPSLGLAYLIGSITNSLDVMNGIANVLTLILAFLGGSFVPQEFLSEGLLRVASFTPNYWFVKANNTLYEMQNFSIEGLKPIFSYMGLQILFGVVFVLIAALLAKQRKKNIV